MNKISFLLVVLLSAFLLGCGPRKDAGVILLDQPWKFKAGDNPAWASPGFADETWATLSVEQPWEKQGYEKLDGYGWYRVRFMLPSSVREESFIKDSLQFLLGKIDDCDQVYLNGSLIGQNTVTVGPGTQPDPDFIKTRGKWYLERRYVVPVNDPRILWDKENVIAVRVYDQDGLGGMFSKPHQVSMIDLKDYVKFDFSKTAFDFRGDTAIAKTFGIINSSGGKDFTGVLSIVVRSCSDGNILYRQDTLVLLKSNETPEFTFSVAGNLALPRVARISFREGASGTEVASTFELPYLLTPPAPCEPRINGTQVFGVRPYSPFLFKVAATGEPPLRYFADDLPPNLKIDEETGQITGYIAKKGTYVVHLCVENHLGHAVRQLRIVVGDRLSLTPPLGWNSWNCWGLSVSDQKIRKSARAMKSSGLIDHGWSYINIDDGWEDKHDKDGVILTNDKFPDMKGLADYVHSLGLKIGIYSSPGPYTCGGYVGSYTFEESDAKSYAAWGIDYLKYDWCSYSRIAPDPTPEQLKHPYKLMHRYLRATGRDIHYSLCQYGMGDVWKWGNEVGGNSWRTTGDIVDTWESLSEIGFSQGKCSPYSAPGNWNDPDMLIVGWVGWGPALHYTQLTPNEQYTHITLWSMLASPLLLGCDLEQLDPFTLNLLTNDEVLAVNQDSLGKGAVQVQANDVYQVWMKELADSSIVVGLFNMTESTTEVPVNIRLLGIKGKYEMRDLWKQQDLGLTDANFGVRVLPHGARMIRLEKKQGS